MGNAAEQLQNAPQPYAAELVELDNAEQQMAELREKYGTVPDYSTKEGYKAGKQAIQALTKMRTGTDKARLAITKPHRDFIDMVNQRAKGLVGEVEQLEAPHREAKREVDEAERRAKEARIAHLRERLENEVTSYLDTAEGLDSTGLAGQIDEAEAIDTEGYFDITKEAEDEKARVLATLRERHAAALERERLAAEREEIERERAELERLRAAQADDWAGLGSALQDVPAADPFGEALEDLQAVAGLDASQAVDVLSAIQRSDIRHVSLQQ
ncbi:hypothetical protein VO226_05560 [Halomonas elongata]|uniref:hypothetical protein n=1 Tax=Halomonas elongata TaxID=2746 RepID=UPI002E2C076C|nr:hypothetical protein [Halomonas elongata]WVI72715.1 hypothetical protein VO226_05560 [Halomonas elongata]